MSLHTPDFRSSQPPYRRRADLEGDVRLTVGIVTKNRPDSLRNCLLSLALVGDSLAEVIIVDDTSETPLEAVLRESPPAIAAKLRLLRQTAHEGYIVARNRIMREASSDYVLLLDDDAWLLDGACIREALALIDAHPQVGAVACAMAGVNGAPWNGNLQPAPVNYACVVPSFIGFAHLLRRHVFLHLGGYRESFQSYGEEKDYCMRLMDAGFEVVYLPDARVVHVPHPSGRVYATYLRHTIRNDCLAALHNEPFPLPLFSVPIRLLRYRRMRGPAARDPGGLRWIVSDLAARLSPVLAERHPVRWTTLIKWRRLRRYPPAWIVPAAAHRSRHRARSAAPQTITVGITSRNRHERLTECLSSLALLGDLISAVVVVDDASDVPVRESLGPLPRQVAAKLTIVRQPQMSGNITCRNVAMHHATTSEVLLLDDDTALLDAATIRRGLALMDRDPRLAAVGFAMAAADGSPLPAGLQPSPANYICYVPSYIGFAHLIRRAAFQQVGGYRDVFTRHGEEKECCLRLLDAGYHVVFVPDPPIVHHIDPTGRNLKRYLRTTVRNDCLGALYNEPLPLALASIPVRLARYLKWRRTAGVADRGALGWIVSELARQLPDVVRGRRPVRWATLRRWRKLRREWPPYEYVRSDKTVRPGATTEHASSSCPPS